jgi:hypothetical protein
MKDYYKILEISKFAGKNEVIKSFRRLAKKYHPDVNKSPEASRKFREVYEAYEILKDDIKRRSYDNILNNEEYQRDAKYQKTYNQTTSEKSSEYENYNKWTFSAKKNAEYYSNLNYRDFFNSVLKVTAKITINITSGILGILLSLLLYLLSLFLNLFEIASVIFIVFFSPFTAFYFSYIFGFISLLISGIFIYFYFRIINKGYARFWIFVKEGYEQVGLTLMIYLIFLTYSIIVSTTFFLRKEEENTKKVIEYQKKISNLNSHISEYTVEYSCENNSNLKIKKGIVVIDMNSYSVDKLFEDLPDTIKTYHHANIKTIVQIWRNENIVGSYTGGSSGIQRSCNYKIIDFDDSVCFLSGELKGTRPPYQKRHRGNAYGSDPIVELKQLILKNIDKE